MAKSKVNSMASRIMDAKQPQTMPMEKTDYPKTAEVRQADNGGFIVKTSGGKVSPYPGEEKVYADLGGVEECLGKHFGKKGSKSEEY